MTVPADPRKLADTAREALIQWGTHSGQYGRREECLAALDALVALAEQHGTEPLFTLAEMQQVREEALRESAAREYAEAALRAAQAKSERQATNIGALYRQRRAAQARADELEKALREIGRERFGSMPDGSTPASYARAVLAASPQAGEHQAGRTT